MGYIESYDIIRLRDKMPLERLRAITKQTMKTFGFVDYTRLFLTMGYVHAFNDKYHIPTKSELFI